MFEEWYRLCEKQQSKDSFEVYMGRLQTVLVNEEAIETFFRLLTVS